MADHEVVDDAHGQRIPLACTADPVHAGEPGAAGSRQPPGLRTTARVGLAHAFTGRHGGALPIGGGYVAGFVVASPPPPFSLSRDPIWTPTNTVNRYNLSMCQRYLESRRVMNRSRRRQTGRRPLAETASHTAPRLVVSRMDAVQESVTIATRNLELWQVRDCDWGIWQVAVGSRPSASRACVSPFYYIYVSFFSSHREGLVFA